jgi:hypothetical protein
MKIRPIPHEPTRFVVESETRPDFAFIVDSDWPGGLAAPKPGVGGWACGCERFMADNEICKHIRDVRRAYPTGRHSLTSILR